MIGFNRYSPSRRLLGIVPLAALLLAGAASPAFADPWWREAVRTPAVANAQQGCLDAPVAPMGDAAIDGNARLCVTEDAVQAYVDTGNLTAGNAYTAWFVYFDRPETCQATPCSPADAIGDNPPGVFGRMDSLVADPAGIGDFAGNFRGLRLSSGSIVRVAIFGHGAASTDDNRTLARQLLTPEEPVLGAPGLGVPAANRHGAAVAVAAFVLP